MVNDLIISKNPRRRNVIIGIIFLLAFGGIIAATVQVIIKETSNYTKAKRILKNYPLIDGYSYKLRD